MAAQTGQSCRLDQSRSWLLQRDLGAKLAADALLPPIWLVRVPRVRLIAETLFAQPLRRVFSPGHYSDIAILGKEAFDRGPSDIVHGDVDPSPERGKREGRTPLQALVSKVVQSKSLVFDSRGGGHFDKELGFHGGYLFLHGTSVWWVLLTPP